jgi:hypothetical protein
MPIDSSRARLVAALALALPLTVSAYDRHGGQADDRLVQKYTRFAGSEANADALVDGLRNDERIRLSSRNGSTTTFTPSTDKMGYGNVDNALSIAKASLAKYGIYRPTPEQIKAALEGGTVTTASGRRVTLTGVLDQRASGMGWGQVAKANGFKLGEVKRDHHGHKHGDWKHGHKHADWKHDRTSKHDRGDFHRTRFERPERPHKFDRPERPERPERHHRR